MWGYRFKVQSSEFKVRGSKFGVQSPASSTPRRRIFQATTNHLSPTTNHVLSVCSSLLCGESFRRPHFDTLFTNTQLPFHLVNISRFFYFCRKFSEMAVYLSLGVFYVTARFTRKVDNSIKYSYFCKPIPPMTCYYVSTISFFSHFKITLYESIC
ncbi:hypothetical protein BH09BAC3_BH09BAC3_38220 [soil metagenome]